MFKMIGNGINQRIAVQCYDCGNINYLKVMDANKYKCSKCGSRRISYFGKATTISNFFELKFEKDNE